MLTSLELKRSRRFSEVGEHPCTAKAQAKMGLPAIAVVVVPPKPAKQLESPVPKGKGNFPNWKKWHDKLNRS
jgi:hypothetical protein